MFGGSKQNICLHRKASYADIICPECENCMHKNTADNPECTEHVCYDCGLVLETVYASHSYARETSKGLGVQEDNKNSRIAKNLASDICSNLHIPYNVESYANWYYEKTLTPKSVGMRFSISELMAFAIYETLNRFETPRPISEISYAANVEAKRLFKIESRLLLEVAHVSPLHYLSRFCSFLDIPYIQQKSIEKIVEQNICFKMRTVEPKCLAAAAIYVHCNRDWKDRSTSISMKHICEVCDVSATNTKKIGAKMSTKFYYSTNKNELIIPNDV